jgi:hypothetical protein
MGKEDNILRKVGTKNPFRVPENYFEDFTQELMSKLPEKETMPVSPEPTIWQRVKPWLYMTAMFCGIMLSVRIFVGPTHQAPFPITMVEAENLTDEEWEIMMSRTFMNDYSLYEYLTNLNSND